MATMKKAHSFLKENWGKILFALVILALAYVSYQYYYIRSQVGGGVALEQRHQVKKAQKDLAQIFDLPSDDPQVAFINNIDAIKTTQPFFAEAQNGDIVLVYTDRIVVYRPSTRKIIALGPVPTNPQGASQTQTTSEISSVEVRNGTATVGLAKKVGERLGASFSNISVESSTPASNKEYTSTIVYSKNDAGKAVAAQIAQALGGQIVDMLPEGEKESSQDIVIIVGSDQK